MSYSYEQTFQEYCILIRMKKYQANTILDMIFDITLKDSIDSKNNVFEG